MRLRIVSWDGDASIAHDGAIFEAYLPDEVTGIFSQVSARPNFLLNEGATPEFLGTTVPAWFFPIKIRIVDPSDTGQSTGRDILAKLFPTTAERNQQKILIAEDIDDGNLQWQITGVTTNFKYDRKFIEIILALAEPRWIEVLEVSDTDTYTSGSGVLLSPEPKGNAECNPILEITPSSQRTSGNSGEEIAHFVEIVNPAGQPALINFAIDLSNGGWNHSTDVGTGDSLATGDDIRVEINGQTVNRYFSGINSASAKIWTHINLDTSIVLKLGVALSAGGSETEVILETTWEQVNLLERMPSAGQFKIGTERFTYTGKEVNQAQLTIKFTGVLRGVLQSSKAAHSINASITRIQNQIFVYQGDTTVVGSSQTVDADNFKPAFELTSSNIQWIYDTEFLDADKQRSWRFNNAITQIAPSPDNLTVGESIIFTDDEGLFTNPATVLGQRMAAVNDPNGSGYKSVSATFAATLEIPFGIKAVTTEGRKARNGTDWVAEHSLWISRGLGDWTRKWNDSTAPASSSGVWEDLDSSIEGILQTLDASAGYRHIVFFMKGAISGGTSQWWNSWQIDKCTLDFVSSAVPVITDKFSGAGSGTSVVELKYQITNSATGDTIEVNATIEIDDTLVLDFQAFEFYILSDNKKLNIAVRPVGEITGHWFMLMGGEANTITITDSGMPTTSMKVRWNGRQA